MMAKITVDSIDKDAVNAMLDALVACPADRQMRSLAIVADIFCRFRMETQGDPRGRTWRLTEYGAEEVRGEQGEGGA